MLEGVDETMPYAPHHLDQYTITKHKAEEAVLAAVAASALQAVILRPACIFGAGDKLVTDYYVKSNDI